VNNKELKEFIKEQNLIKINAEPKKSNKFIVDFGVYNSIIIDYIDIPKCKISIIKNEDGKYSKDKDIIWDDIKFKASDYISPSTSQLIMELVNQTIPIDIHIYLLDPIDNIISHWKLYNAELVYVNFGTLNQQNENITIDGIIRFERAELLY